MCVNSTRTDSREEVKNPIIVPELGHYHSNPFSTTVGLLSKTGQQFSLARALAFTCLTITWGC